MIKINEQAQHEPSLQESMTPMVDVIFSLLAFMMLMINAPLLTSKLDLPANEQATPLSKSAITPVTLLVDDKSARWKLGNSDWLDKEQLTQQLLGLKQQPTPAPVVLQMNKDLPVQRLIDTMAALQTAGISATEIATVASSAQ
ncbi:MAG: ExbD/TolR family protein [Vibrionaceae bacterium]